MACAHTQSDHCPLCAPTLDAPLDQTVVPLSGPDGSPAPESLQPGQQIGRYVITERLGAGGMGVLYRAHDPQLQRIVAIKVLRAAIASRSPAAQARLLREAQAMAQLAHPNVVPVYDSGPFGAGIFIAMELVEGTSLDLWMKEKHPWREVVRVFVEAGRGLEAAHAKGLIHRDFKPANVLLGDDGRPRVTDFGLARARRGTGSSSDVQHDDDEVTEPFSSRPTPLPLTQALSQSSLGQPLTQAGVMMGSPGYMAPEQYEGVETSEATDQFAFCVSLYEALYGQKLFVGDSLKELAEATYAGKVPVVAKSGVPMWLHRIIVKGLAQQAKDRHPSMTALLAQLSHDPGRKQRLLAVGAAAVLVVAVVGGLAWKSNSRERACRGAEKVAEVVWNDAAKRRSEQAFLATGVPFAKASWVLTREALDGYVQRWTAARTEACEATRLRAEQTERQMLLRLECLDRRLTELNTLVGAFSQADVPMVSSAANATAQLSPIAECSNVKQLEDRRAPPPQLEARARELADSLARGRALIIAGKVDDARRLLSQVVKDTVELKLPTLEAASREAMGELHSLGREFIDARREFELAVRAAEVAGDDATAARVLSRMVSLVGWRMQRPEEGRTWAALASGIVERIGGDVATEARIEEGLGDAEWQDGDRAKALAAYRRSLELYVKATGPETLDAARLHSSAGWVLTEQGALDEARAELEASRTIRERMLGAEHPALADTWNELSTLALELRDYDEAIRCQETAVRLSQAAGSRLLAAEVSAAWAMALGGRSQAALDRCDRLREGIDHDQTPASWVEYGRVRVLAMTRLGRVKEALAEGRVTLAEQERKLGKLQPEVASMADILSETAFAAGLWQEAIDLAERYLAMKAALGGADAPRTGETLLRSATAHLALKRPLEAAPRAERALVAIEKGKLDRKLRGEARRVLAMSLLASGHEGERAELLLQQAKEDALAAGDAALLERIGQR